MDGPDSCVPERDTEARSFDDCYQNYGVPLGLRAVTAGLPHFPRSVSRKRLCPDDVEPARGAGTNDQNDFTSGPLGKDDATSSMAGMLLEAWTRGDCSGLASYQPSASARFDSAHKSLNSNLLSSDKASDAVSHMKQHLSSTCQTSQPNSHQPGATQAIDASLAQQVPVLTPDQLRATAPTAASHFPFSPVLTTIRNANTAAAGLHSWAVTGPSAGHLAPYSALLSGPGFSITDDGDDLSNDISIGSDDSDSLDSGFMIDTAATEQHGDGEDVGLGRHGCRSISISAALALARPAGTAHSGSGGRTTVRERSAAATAATAAGDAAEAAGGDYVVGPGASAGAVATAAAAAGAVVVMAEAGGAVMATAEPRVDPPGPGDAVAAAEDSEDGMTGGTGVGSTGLSAMHSVDAGDIAASGLPPPAAWSPLRQGANNDTLPQGQAEAGTGDAGGPELLLRSISSESVGSADGAVPEGAGVAAGAVAVAAAATGAEVAASFVSSGGDGMASELASGGSYSPTAVAVAVAVGAPETTPVLGADTAEGGAAGALPVLLPPFLGVVGLPVLSAAGALPGAAAAPWMMPTPAGAAAAIDPAAALVGAAVVTAVADDRFGVPAAAVAAPAVPAAVAVASGSMAVSTAGVAGSATAPAALPQPLPSLLPPETYLGFISQLVESVRTATRAVTTHAACALQYPGAGHPVHGAGGHAAAHLGLHHPQLPSQAAATVAVPPLPGTALAGGFRHLASDGAAGGLAGWPLQGGGAGFGRGGDVAGSPTTAAAMALQQGGVRLAAPGPLGSAALASWLVASEGTSGTGPAGEVAAPGVWFF